MFWTILMSIMCIIMGAITFLKPEWVWKVTEQWKSYYADAPSDFYLFTTKLAGIFSFVVGVAGVIMFLVLEW